MATHPTHITLTDSIYNKYFSDCSKKEFILWTLLPDIRYLDKGISRDKYHINNMSLEKVLSEKSSFQKWVYFHSLVDQIRDAFYISKWIYIPGWDEDFIIALKLFEDQYLYNKIKKRDEYINMFDDIPYKNTAEIKNKTIEKRYMIIKGQISKKPNNKNRIEFAKKLGFTKEYQIKINNIIGEIEKNEKLISIVDELYDSFEKLLQR